MMQKVQRFGGAMFTPVLLFAFSGIILAISIMLTNPLIMGGIADPSTGWYKFWIMIQNGGWTVFNQMELLFVVGLPTGLHHFIYIPFLWGPAVVPDGIQKYWLAHLQDFAQSTKSLKELFPAGGFALFGNDKIWPPIGIAAAFYATAKPEKRKKLLALLIPAVLTAIAAGITEPFEFTFLFAAPVLFIVHALLCGAMDAIMFLFGVVGSMDSGVIDMATKNWIPLFANHWSTYIAQWIIGLSFVVIYFLLFRFLILKFNFPTPGREADNEEAQLHSKADYKEKMTGEKEHIGYSKNNQYTEAAATYLDALGGYDNIQDVTNCATRLRVTVKDDGAVLSDAAFKAAGAAGVVRHGKAFQIIVGLSVPQVREEFERLLKQGIK